MDVEEDQPASQPIRNDPASQPMNEDEDQPASQPMDLDQPTNQADTPNRPASQPGPSASQLGSQREGEDREAQGRGSLRDRISPDIPPPRLPPAGDSDIEWAQIDRIGGWKAIISPFGAIDQIPAQHKAVWAWAWGAILVKVQSAVSDLDLDRALMWFLFLPQALCRNPRRGGVQGRGFINKRFNALAN